MSTVPSPTDFLKMATSTAEHFGFQSVESLKKDPGCKSCQKKIEQKSSANDRKLDSLHGMLTSGICTYFDSRFNGIERPVLFYTTDNVPRSGEAALTLQVYGVEKSIAEALLIQTLRSLLVDLGQEDHHVRINSLGDSDSVGRYVRELNNYMRKRIDDMPAPARELMKEHVFASLMHLIEKDHELAHKSPSPLEYLSDSSRRHFREIIEFLDMSNTPYEIDPKLIGNYQCYSDALFAIDINNSNGEEEIAPFLVQGGRYNAFVERMSRTHTPAAGAVIVLRNRKAPSRMPRPQKGSVPSVFVVQLGFGPKIRSLLIIDELRRAGISVYQDIVSDSLSTQLRTAEAKKVKYTIIVGQKEFVEGNVILRDMRARSQESVPADALASHLKRIVRN